MSNSIDSKQVQLARPLVGVPRVDDFVVVSSSLPALNDGDLLLSIEWASVDPYLRGVLSRTPPNTAIVAGSIGRVLESRSSSYVSGDLVVGQFPWGTHAVVSASTPGLRKLSFPVGVSPSVGLGACGMPGMTAYFGLLRCCPIKDGSTILVSGAAGAVGSVVGQLAHLLYKDVTVIGTAGGSEKCGVVVSEFGFDHCIDYKKFVTAAEVQQELKRLAPKGIDSYFDNTGGHVTDATWDLLNKFGSVAVCGQISIYNSDPANPPTTQAFLHKTIYKSVTVKGFVVTDFIGEAAAFFQAVVPLVAQGKLKVKETIYNGVDEIPKAFVGLFTGENYGKAIIKL